MNVERVPQEFKRGAEKVESERKALESLEWRGERSEVRAKDWWRRRESNPCRLKTLTC